MSSPGQRPPPIFLIGFMGSGKSTVGRSLAADLGMPFVDLDRVIEEDAGKTVAEIFASDGEAQFRSLETAALTRVASTGGAIVATGGGAPMHDDNLDTMRRAGLVLALDASLAELGRRVGDGEGRPLWNAEDDRSALYRSRLPAYRRAHAIVHSEGRGIAEVGRHAARLVELAGRLPEKALEVTTLVALEAADYPVVVGDGELGRVGEHVTALLGEGTRIAIITDDHVAALYEQPVRDSLDRAHHSVICTARVSPGEASKSLTEFGRLCEEIVAAGADRQTVVLALGGGVVGDLAGFVASSVLRGLRLLQVPTTLLAMVDSSVGGKTGINLEHGKNLVGSFWQPSLVIADPEVLATLPVRERRAAIGELVKYGLLDGEELLGLVEALGPELGADVLPSEAPFRESLAEVIRRCVAYKAWIVGRDERELRGDRALLNLGHTVGHAIEAAAGYGVWVHGEAVALGLVAACRVSHRLGLCEAELEQRVARLFAAAGLETDLAPHLRPEVIERIKVDKKRTGDRVAFITLSEPGECARTPLDLAELARTLRA